MNQEKRRVLKNKSEKFSRLITERYGDVFADIWAKTWKTWEREPCSSLEEGIGKAKCKDQEERASRVCWRKVTKAHLAALEWARGTEKFTELTGNTKSIKPQRLYVYSKFWDLEFKALRLDEISKMNEWSLFYFYRQRLDPRTGLHGTSNLGGLEQVLANYGQWVKSACSLFPYSPQAENGFYVF